MENRTMFIEPLVEKLEAYGKTSYELAKLKALKKTSTVLSVAISRAIAILLLSMFTIIINIGLSFWLGELLGKSYYGFYCVASFYGISGIVVYFMLHHRIRNWIRNNIISELIN